MIYHQSQFGHTIIIPTELYYSLTDDELTKIEERYLNVDSPIISYGGRESNSDDDKDLYRED